MTASGTAMRKTEPHQNRSSRAPATKGPRAAAPPLTLDQSAMAFVRPGPAAHRAVMSASVVG